MSTTVQLRIDAVTKNKAQKILKKIGLDLSSAIKLFLTQVVNRKSLPLDFRTENGFTPAEEKKMLRESAWAKKHAKRFTSVDEAFEYLNS